MTRISSEEALLDAALESPECAPFAWFNVDVPVEGGHVVPLWEIRSNGGNEADREREERIDAASSQRLRVDAMAIMVALDLPLFEEEEAPQEKVGDEWERFWGGESPTETQAHYRED